MRPPDRRAGPPLGDIDIAEEAAGEGLVAPLEKWPESGVPANPGGWLTTTAGYRAIDRIRRENLVPETMMAQRITRAKRKIAAAKVSWRR